MGGGSTGSAADGTPLASALTRPGSQPILNIAQAKTGVLTAWSVAEPAESILVQTLDDDGHPTSSPTPVASPMGIAIPTLAPAPDGDVVLAWFEIDQGSTYHLFAMDLGPDGSPRGPATALGVFPLLVDWWTVASVSSSLPTGRARCSPLRAPWTRARRA